MTYLTKYLAQAGIASRRQAEELIRNGKVTVDGERAELGMMVEGTEDIRVRGKKVDKSRTGRIVMMLNKPIGYTCTNRRFAGEENIFSLLPKSYEKLIIAGRLDKDSRGLLLLTNDGDLANRITHPRFGHDKTYMVRFAGEDRMDLDERKLYAKAKEGVRTDEGEILRAKAIRRTEDRWLVTLGEGKKRHIRRMFSGMGLKVIDLQRVAIGNLELGGLPQGRYRLLNEKELALIEKK
ncbi:MAG: pseudouridine synthase [Bacillota bacterium]